ncbi:hypothetical protein ACFXJ5_11440 [Streptomyces sp. NPDC059373]
MRHLAAVAVALFMACFVAGPAMADDGSPSSFTITDSRIKESSGLAASHLHKGIYWTHNDSGDGPYIYAVDSATGKTVATVTMRGVGTPRDVEAISIGPDDQIYVGDIGDNLDGAWDHVWIYRFPEPSQLKNMTVTATQYVVRYRDGARNAESLMIDPKTGRAYIISKNENGGGLYVGPQKLSASGVNIFRRIADIPLWATDAAFSPDGTRLAVRGYFGGLMYRWSGGAPHKIGDLDVPIQQQGESVSFTPDGRALMYGSEGKDSDVTRKNLSGDDLPDSVTSASASASAGTGASGSSPSGPTASDGTSTRNFTVGAVTLAAVVAVLVAARRLRRGR